MDALLERFGLDRRLGVGGRVPIGRRWVNHDAGFDHRPLLYFVSSIPGFGGRGQSV
jgi:hypothetical protein